MCVCACRVVFQIESIFLVFCWRLWLEQYNKAFVPQIHNNNSQAHCSSWCKLDNPDKYWQEREICSIEKKYADRDWEREEELMYVRWREGESTSTFFCVVVFMSLQSEHRHFYFYLVFLKLKNWTKKNRNRRDNNSTDRSNHSLFIPCVSTILTYPW